MYLKSIEIQGFKSFANKIHFEFHNGITGIVGPNGSGKSNVADAVRWVLGEQSAKQLRGGNMQDVIFSGTENRKPMGLASVAITLDNSDHALDIDFQEVTVTRRIYRSGESEYLLNGTACRLKDINELFYDTGIGKEGYSIIGQGQIDKILSGKPEDRRELFDEAAGIVKFKRRKNMTIKKLEQEESNLVRVTDILSELTKQLAPLKRQSETAKIYLKKKDELKEIDTDMFRIEMKDNAQKMSAVERSIEIADEQKQNAVLEMERTKAEYEALEQALAQLENNIEDQKNEAKEKELTRQQTEGQITLLKEQIHNARTNHEQYKTRIDAVKNELLQSEHEAGKQLEEKEKLLQEIHLVEDENAKNEDTLSGLQEQAALCREKIEENQAAVITLLNERGSIKGQLQRYDAMVEQIQIRRASIHQQLLQMKTDEAELQTQCEKYQTEYNALTASMDEMTAEQNQMEDEIHALQKKIAEDVKKMEEGQTSYHRESSRLESLRNIAERYDGYGVSIRKIMEQKDRNEGIKGVVADLIRTEKRYETAIETALGGNIQNIVTDNESTAKYLIEYLKRGKFGRATFLPLTTVKGQSGSIRADILNETGVLGIADSLVTTETQYRALIGQLLGRTLVVDHIDHAISIGRKYRHSVRMVTLDGDLLNPGGSMTGGAYRNSSNLLGRKREIDELEQQVRILQKNMIRMQKKMDDDRSRRNLLRDTSAEITNRIREKIIAQNTAKMNMEQALGKAREMQTGYLDIQNEQKEIDFQIREININKQDIEKEIQESKLQEKALETATAKLQDELAVFLAEEETLHADSLEIQVRNAALAQKTDFIDENLARINRQRKLYEQELQDIKDNQSAGDEQIKSKEEQIVLLSGSITDLTSSIESLQQLVSEAISKKEEMNRQHHSFFAQRDELSDRIHLLDRETLRLTNQKEKLEDFRESRISYMWEEYEITLNQSELTERKDPKDLKLLKKEAAECRDDIRKLGPVNVNAIEDYKNLKERHDFLNQQYVDLVEAKKTLEGIIKELDEGMRKQFVEKFALISKEFDKVFRELFGGGKGTLELVENEDILEAGIRIISQPPGKKLQNMMQLSGGEKALTAIALLFAIQNLKPSPFCLLDEIEAALDDANVTRYARYLHKLTKNTQFIIITHRRGTMAAADRLYGITMQEKGVSALVSVNLIENNLDT